MNSPFPGMDPYLEARWSNFHVLMVGAIAIALKKDLPSGLEARPEEEVRIETLAGERIQHHRPDVSVVHTAKPLSRSTGSSSVVEPIVIPYHNHAPVTIRNVQIVEVTNGDRVITVIEVLSPWNKLPGDLNRRYVRKLHAFEDAGTNWVEIDLLRGSRERLPVTWEDLPADRRGDYLILTYRRDEEKIQAFPRTIRDPLPKFSIPLRDPSESVALDLQAVLNRVYEEGPFDSIDYSKPPKPPLVGDDAAWAAQLIREKLGAA